MLVRYEKLVSAFLISISVIVFLFFLIPANMDLAEGRYHLFMDEEISFVEVRDILHSKDIKSFLYAVFDGDDHRYGRIMYNISAFVSFLPEKIWGDAGQIIATRMLLFALLAVAYLFLVKTFIKRTLYQALAFILMLLIPTTVYYSTMPKPEPFLIFSFSVFLYFHVKNEYKFGKHFFWLGLAFGAKISILFAAVFLFAHSLYLALIKPVKDENFLHNDKFAVLLKRIFFIKNNRKFFQLFESIQAVGFFFLGLVVSVPILLFSVINREYFFKWRDWTFLLTTHGADDSKVNILSWIQGIYSSFITAPVVLSIIITLIIFSYIFINLVKSYIRDGKKIFTTPLFVVFVLALSLLLPIMLLTKRLWFIYLHIGIVLLIIAFFIAVSLSINKRLQAVTLFFVFSFSIIYIFPSQVTQLLDLARRTNTEEYIQQKKIYDYYGAIVNNDRKLNPNESISVFVNPRMFQYENADGIEYERYWGPFTAWDQGKKYIFMQGDGKNPRLNPLQPSNNNYKAWLKACETYDKYVESDTMKPSYDLMPATIEGLAVFKRVR